MSTNQVRIQEALDKWEEENAQSVVKAVRAIYDMARCLGIDYADRVVNQTIAQLLKDKPEYNFKS